MKKILMVIVCCLTATIYNAGAQNVMAGLGIDPDNVCWPGNVMIGVSDPPVPMERIAEIERRLNETVDFARLNPDLYAEPVVRFAVNCRGELGGGFYMASSTGDAHLDNGLLNFFMSVDRWRPGMNGSERVDCWAEWWLVMRDGRFTILRLLAN